MRVATVDLGTNSTRLLIADVDNDGAVADVLSRSVVTRMGEGVDRGGVIGDAAIERVLGVLDDYRSEIEAHGVARGVALLTSAGRDAANGTQFAERVSEALRLPARVIDGNEEARLTFAGATLGRRTDAELAVLDIGGGSTEVAIGRGGTVTHHGSAQVGVVRHKERFLHRDPPRNDEVRALRADVHRALRELAGERRAAQTISVGGTPVSCATMLGHAQADGAVVSREQCEELLARVVTMSEAALRSMQGLHPARAPAIVAGIAIHLEAIAVLGAESFEVSERDLRHGAALALTAI